jgi:uncharacterized phage protein (TIGR02220 family)
LGKRNGATKRGGVLNYYRRYVGDYLRDTSRLSMIEHGAYNLLLDYYYAEERPIPIDLEEVYRMVRAILPEERRSVVKVLTSFFTKGEDGYRQKRVDHEIEVSKKARSNGSKGGRPLTETETGYITGSETGYITETETGSETEEETGLVTGDGGGSGHPPTTNHQPPTTNHQEEPKDTVRQKPNLKPLAVEVLNFLNIKTGRRYEPVPANLSLIAARLREGASVDDLRAVVAKKCRDWGGDPKMNEYLRPKTLFNATNYAQYRGELVAVEAE